MSGALAEKLTSGSLESSGDLSGVEIKGVSFYLFIYFSYLFFHIVACVLFSFLLWKLKHLQKNMA